MAPAFTITIETFSDTICPWSYIGKKILDKAIEEYKEQHPGVKFEVTWNPFYLYPGAKISAYTKRDYYAARFGPRGVAMFCERVDKGAAALGLSIKWDGPCGNTRDSHVLLLLAQQQDHQQQQQQQQQKHQEKGDVDGGNNISFLQATQDALFQGVFERGRDVSDRGFLAEVARGVGLCTGGSDEAVARLLDDGELRARADALDRRAKGLVGITAVPSYLVQGRYRVGGQQQAEVFLRLFDRIRTEGGGGARE